MASLLLLEGANPDMPDKNGKTPLILAAENGNLIMIRNLVAEGSYVDHQTRDGRTSLMISCERGYEDCTRFLCDSGANTEIKDAFGWTALMHAVKYFNKQCLNILLKYNADPNVKMDIPLESGIIIDNGTALTYASAKGNADIVEILIKAGANINSSDSRGFNALSYSAKYGHSTTAVFLKSKGVKAHKITERRIQSAAFGHKYDSDASSKDEIPDVSLITGGMDVNSKDEHGFTGLMYAVINSDKQKVLDMLNLGAEVNAKNNIGDTSLMLALMPFNKEISDLLLKNGADINAGDNEGMTPLLQSVFRNNTGAVEFLIYRGADINKNNNYGTTPLKLAENLGFKSLVSMLRKRGAK